MDPILKIFSVASKAVDIDAGIFEAMISTEDVDRDGDIVRATGARLENYLLNPIVLYAHNYMNTPVAKALSVEIQPGQGLKATFQFPEWGASEQADTVRRLWAGKFLNATSIGFRPLKWKKRTNDGQDPDDDEEVGWYWGPKEYTLWELLEFSIVPVPANQAALRLAYQAFKRGVESQVRAPDMGQMREHMDGMDDAMGDMREHMDAMRGMMDEDEEDAARNIQTKRGRVLSAANEKRIRGAVTSLQEVLDSIGEEPEEGDNDGKGPKTALPYRDQGTADEGASWSAPSLGNFTDETFEDLSAAEKRCIAAHYTWSANMPPEAYGDLKLPHHKAQTESIGPAIWRGVAAAMAALLGGRGGVAIPDGERRAVYNHLKSHYAQYDKEPPEFREYSGEELKQLFPDVDDPAEPIGDAEPTNPDPSEYSRTPTPDASEAELAALSGNLSKLSNVLTELLK